MLKKFVMPLVGALGRRGAGRPGTHVGTRQQLGAR